MRVFDQMGFFISLFRKRAKQALDDPIFGHIEFDTSSGMGIWCHVSSEQNPFMIIIEAPPTGPTQGQRDFYLGLRNELAVRLAECKKFIADQDEAPSNLSDLNLYSIVIGPEIELKSGQFTLELSNKNADLIHVIDFVNGKPETYGVDD